MKGLLITLEGGEGAGKSTLIAALKARLESASRKVLLTREPGGTPLGEKVRTLLLESDTPISQRSELLLFLSARAEHVEAVIKPAIERGDIVLCDRFTHSTLAYQGYARGLNLVELKELCAFATDGLQPDLTLYLDVPVSVGMARVGVRGGTDRMENEKNQFHEAVRSGFLEMAKEPHMIQIDAELSPENVFELAWKAVELIL